MSTQVSRVHASTDTLNPEEKQRVAYRAGKIIEFNGVEWSELSKDGFKKGFLQQLRADRVAMSYDELVVFAKALNVRPEFLLNEGETTEDEMEAELTLCEGDGHAGKKTH